MMGNVTWDGAAIGIRAARWGGVTLKLLTYECLEQYHCHCARLSLRESRFSGKKGVYTGGLGYTNSDIALVRSEWIEEEGQHEKRNR
jgi:hypothetical protein